MRDMTKYGQEKKFQLDPESGSVDIAMLQYMHPAIVFLIAWTNMWCLDNRITPMWTSLMRTHEENEALGATSTHIYRAADLSLKELYGWNITKRNKYERALKDKFNKLGAIVNNAKGRSMKRVIVRHDIGHGDHFHLQVSPYAKLSDLK